MLFLLKCYHFQRFLLFQEINLIRLYSFLRRFTSHSICSIPFLKPCTRNPRWVGPLSVRDVAY